MSNSEVSQTDRYPKYWQIQDPFILFAFCLAPYKQFWEEMNSIQEKIGAVQCLKVHVQEKIRIQHVLLEMLFSCMLPSDTNEREERLEKYAKMTLYLVVSKNLMVCKF